MAERRLGRGLGSLLSESAPEAQSTTKVPSKGPSGEVLLAEISPNPFQPRKNFSEEGLRELTDSIKTHGVLQPVVVRAKAGGFELVSGERRCRAAKQAGLESIPAVIRDVPDSEMLELALVENVQRRDLDPIERAIGFRDMQESLSLTQEQVASKVGLKRTTVTNHLRLLELPKKAQEALVEGLISMGHARALLGLPTEKDVLSAMESVVRGELSVRQAEDMVRARSTTRVAGKPEQPRESNKAPWVVDAERRMREHLGARVKLQNSSGYQGRIVIEYSNKDILEGLLEKLGPKPTL